MFQHLILRHNVFKANSTAMHTTCLLYTSPKLTALQVELAQVQHEIETLIDTLTGANPVLPVSYTHLDVYKRQGVYKTSVRRTMGQSVPNG